MMRIDGNEDCDIQHLPTFAVKPMMFIDEEKSNVCKTNPFSLVASYRHSVTVGSVESGSEVVELEAVPCH